MLLITGMTSSVVDSLLETLFLISSKLLITVLLSSSLVMVLSLILTLIDSPGFIIPTSLNNDVTNKDIKMLSYNMKDNESIQLLNNKYFIKVENNTSLTLFTNYKSDNLVKKYYKDINLENKIVIKDNQDLIIYGIGIIRFKTGTTIYTNLPNESIEIRDSIFGGYYE